MKRLLLSCALASILLSGCASEAERAAAHNIITVLPDAVQDCVFLGEVDSTARASLGNSRFEAKLAAARLGATHMVEVHTYAAQMTNRDFGSALSGRAYKCPAGTAVADDPEALLETPEPIDLSLYDDGIGYILPADHNSRFAREQD